MSQPNSAVDPATPQTSTDTSNPSDPVNPETEAPPSFVKLAMRNMVRKGGKSLFHFSLTVTALLGLLVGLAYLTR